jgi:hypothetical protein
MRHSRCLRDKVVVPYGFLPARRQRAKFSPQPPKHFFGAFVSATIPPRAPERLASSILFSIFTFRLTAGYGVGLSDFCGAFSFPIFPPEWNSGISLFFFFYSAVVWKIFFSLFFVWIDDDKGTCRAKDYGRLFDVGCFLFPPSDNQVKRGANETSHFLLAVLQLYTTNEHTKALYSSHYPNFREQQSPN